jgi:hypothetical protein
MLLSLLTFAVYVHWVVGMDVPPHCFLSLEAYAADVQRKGIGRWGYTPALFTLTQRDPTHPEAGMAVRYSFTSDGSNGSNRFRFRGYQYILSSLFSNSSLPFRSVMFLLNADNECCHVVPEGGPPLPHLSQCVSKDPPTDCSHVGVVPSYSTLSLSPFYSSNESGEKQRKRDARKMKDWKRKIDKVFWRGSPTGPGPVMDRPRVQNLIRLVSHPDVDACFSTFSSIGKNSSYYMAQMTSLGIACPDKKIEFHEFGKYRYVLDMDGFSWSDRFIHLLSLGSTIFKQTAKYEDIATLKARPNVHYVPLKPDLSDLDTALRRCRENPSMCQKIAENGMKLIEEEFSFEKRREIWASQLIEYHEKCGSVAK